MDRLACVDLPAFPLQLLFGAHPEWRGEPAAVVERDAPHGRLTWVNARARDAGVLPGQRYSAALALCARLRAGEISAHEIEIGVRALTEHLQRFSPRVEPCGDEPGVFWADVRGLERLFGAPRTWAEALHASLRARGFDAGIAVGFRRFAVYAAAKSLARTRIAVFDDREHETRVALAVPLRRLALDPDARDALEKLGVKNLGDFVRLPAGGILERHGAHACRLHQLASGALDEQLEPAPEVLPFAAHADFELPESDLDRLLLVAQELAQPLCAQLACGGEAVSKLTLRLALDGGTRCVEELAPARPTLDLAWLVRLLRLRLEHVALASGVVRLELELGRARVASEQVTLFAETKKRSAAAAAKAFSALRAAFGELAVVRARLRSAHLPEVSWAWEQLDALAPARPRRVLVPRLVRRVFDTALPLAPRGRREPDGWLLRGVSEGPVAKLAGPYLLNGGWWRQEVQREYHFAELKSGAVFWIYFDRRRRRWFLQGGVA